MRERDERERWKGEMRGTNVEGEPSTGFVCQT
jgi:hypothetical protein